VDDRSSHGVMVLGYALVMGVVAARLHGARLFRSCGCGKDFEIEE